ncbi:thioesterase family protein [Streptomyces sp. ISID311]|uniref:acyl-CoA thioesterase n=1 Tax=Streptomyces sp. ISID311 TaxID=2601673 RepID=UPI0011BD317C|nr:thioesterase family protein [Streptomyces sp. ISID311]TXC99872.1 acyl-CoA thioesterase [Streptomyces sp. ISID311]
MNRFTHQCHMRWSDMDANRHVNNVMYCRYLEEARVHMLFGLLTPEVEQAPTRTFVVSQQTVRFASPLIYQLDPITVDIWATRVQSLSCDLASEVKGGGRTYATALTTIVSYDIGTSGIRPLQPEELDRLNHYRGPLPKDFLSGAAPKESLRPAAAP